MLLYPKWGVKCIPDGYIKPEDSCSRVFQKLMGADSFKEISENETLFNGLSQMKRTFTKKNSELVDL